MARQFYIVLFFYLFIYLFIYLYFFIYFLYDKLANNYSSTHTFFFFHVNLSLYFKLFPAVGFKMIVFMTMMMMTMMMFIYHIMIIATLSF